MAMFRHHISVGAVVSTAAVVLVYSYGLLTDPWNLGILFAICAFASMIPDFDSDSGLPFYLIFGATTVAFGGYVFYHTLNAEQSNWYILVGLPLAALVGYWLIVGGIVKRLTEHRGMWHSFPMLLIWSLATYTAALWLGVAEQTAKLYAVAMALGFLSHLYLDEVWSNIDGDGNPFTYKRSLGTALKFFSRSLKVNVVMYIILAGLAYIALNQSGMVAQFPMLQ